MAATNTGDWNWNPQPTAVPAARSASSAPPRPANATSTPAVYAAPCQRASPSRAPARPTAFIASTGKTQGIRLRISPPRKANPSRRRRPMVGGRGGRCLGWRAARHRSPARCGRGRQDARQPTLGLERLAGSQRQREAACQTVRGCAALSWIVPGASRDEPGVVHGGGGQLGALHEQRAVAPDHRVPGRRPRHLPVESGEQRRLGEGEPFPPEDRAGSRLPPARRCRGRPASSACALMLVATTRPGVTVTGSSTSPI